MKDSNFSSGLAAVESSVGGIKSLSIQRRGYGDVVAGTASSPCKAVSRKTFCDMILSSENDPTLVSLEVLILKYLHNVQMLKACQAYALVLLSEKIRPCWPRLSGT